MKDRIVVRGARQHNLRDVSVDFPRRAITVVTGPSGSGKSSLAFDTIYAEGQRRYVESLSAYARQFLERMPKPDVDAIDGLSPSVAIEQKNPTRTSRSTVGTATEITDYLRLLWARVGRTICPHCGRVLKPDSAESACDAALALPEGTRLLVSFPFARSSKLTHARILEHLRAKGFVRVIADGAVLHLDELTGSKPNLTKVAELLVVTDRLAVSPAARTRLADALETAFSEGDGDAVVVPVDQPTDASSPRNAVAPLRFTTSFRCPNDGHVAPEPTPQLFSFNNPRGACETCNGFGATLEYDEALIVPYPERSLAQGALDPWTKPRYENKRRALAEFAKANGIPLDVAWRDLAAGQREKLLRGKAKGYVGMFPFLDALEPKKYKQYIRIFLRQYQTAQTCTACGGARLRAEALQVRIAGKSIAEVQAMPVGLLRAWLDTIELSAQESAIAAHILREARDRIAFLCDVGLTYLSLDRATRTLSGGEAQRIGLANSLGARLVDTLYVLDEPSIGLHPSDLGRLLDLLKRLRDTGNTVLMVEHDLDAIRLSDWMLELGPASGEQGGQVVFSGPTVDAASSPLTGQFLTGARTIAVPAKRRRAGPQWLTLDGAREHNLRNVSVKIPLGALTCVTGVSGSGKSTLVHDVLFRALERLLTGEHSARQHLGERVGAYESLEGWQALDDVVLVDQEPIGKSPRSNPVTYVKAFDEIRRIFAEVPLARQRRYTAGTFSFNVAGGRCETCEGAGALEVEMVFMADVFVPCETCGGTRYKPEVLDVTYFGKRITDVLEMTVDQAIRFFPREEKLGQALWQIQQVGLGYLRLGQPATTLSGGESQRLKVARELAFAAKKGGRKCYILDEPTTGLHPRDVEVLCAVLDRLVDNGHTVIVIEHDMDVVKRADWVIDLGPNGGDDGGRVVAMGTPEQVARAKNSLTARHLAPFLGV
ncbi:MAG: excinuclease ABC subunit UvrA [Gemmatimonadaceae bacterium]|nr:excinuclease ABC subunit UvrA [Gemmatimonadaceae bacterium]MCW5825647.1 excinuclease ABC subunit UvrA [Gemmatimonadaceae bacterium]